MNPLTRQTHVVDFLNRSQKEKRLAHAYLFFGGDHLDKVDLSKYFAKLILQLEENSVAAHLIDHDQHPNVIRIKPEGKNIKKEQVAHLKTEATKKAVEQGAKIYILEEAEHMSTAAINSLLKFLEEPEGNTYIVLIARAKETLLPTIVSRTINLYFKRSQPTTFDPELLEIVTELETSKQGPEIVLAKHQGLIKEKQMTFLETYVRYYEQLLNHQLNLTTNDDLPLLSEAAIQRNNIKGCLKKIRKGLEAQANLKMNMNASLCLDLLLQGVRDN